MMAGDSVLRFYPMEVIHSFKFIRTWRKLTYYVGVVHWVTIDGRPQRWM